MNASLSKFVYCPINNKLLLLPELLLLKTTTKGTYIMNIIRISSQKALTIVCVFIGHHFTVWILAKWKMSNNVSFILKLMHSICIRIYIHCVCAESVSILYETRKLEPIYHVATWKSTFISINWIQFNFKL